MALPPPNPKGHSIPVTDAAEQTRRFRAGLNKGGMFYRAELDQLLAQGGCAGLRFYYGRKDTGEDTLILVGVDQAGNDMVKGMVLEVHFPCPPFCGDANALNS